MSLSLGGEAPRLQSRIGGGAKPEWQRFSVRNFLIWGSNRLCLAVFASHDLDLTQTMKHKTTSLCFFFPGFLILLLVLLPEARAGLAPGEVEFFEDRIRPVLAQDCYECHRTEAT